MSLRPSASRLRSLSLTFSLLSCSAVVLAGCGGPMADIFDGTKFSSASMGVKASPRVTSSRNVPKGGGRYQVGQPYTVAGKRFVPREQPDLDQVGQASWYGPAFHGRLTANGEIFDQYHLSGAHPTLPLPSYVRVTNLDNGNSTIVRINDRGPFSHNRVIDLSRRTAEVLGFKTRGTANVRVQYVGPAPLNGDDTRFLVASINSITPYEMQTRMAYQETRVAQTQPATALDAATAVDPQPAEIPFQVLSYADSAAIISEPFGQPARIDLGEFRTQDEADNAAMAFATLGAVDRVTVGEGSAAVTKLAITHLREGVTSEDVHDLATSLGLTAPTLY